LEREREEAMKDDFESALFEPWVVLPTQVAVDAPWGGATSGSIALMQAVLEDAVRCIDRGRRSRHMGIRQVAVEAEAWVRSDSRQWPFAFVNICDALGLDVEAARVRLLSDGQHLASGTRPRSAIRRRSCGRGRTSVCTPRTGLAA
jgi:hypothetical protein